MSVFPPSDSRCPPSPRIGEFQIIDPGESECEFFDDYVFNPFKGVDDDLVSSDGDSRDSREKKKARDGKEPSERKSFSRRDKARKTSSRSRSGGSKAFGDSDEQGRSRSSSHDRGRSKLNASRTKDEKHNRDDQMSRSRHREDGLPKGSSRRKSSNQHQNQESLLQSRKIERHKSDRERDQDRDRVRERRDSANSRAAKNPRKTDLNQLVRNGSIRNFHARGKSMSSRNLMGSTTALEGSGTPERRRSSNLTPKKLDSDVVPRTDDESESDLDEDEHLKSIRDRHAPSGERGPVEAARGRELSLSRHRAMPRVGLSRAASARGLGARWTRSKSSRALLASPSSEMREEVAS